MSRHIFIPSSLQHARNEIRRGMRFQLANMPLAGFLRAWCSLFYLFPGLHPDEYDEVEGGWPLRLRRFAAEAWRRAGDGEIADDQLYPCDAQWSGICDRTSEHTREEADRRARLAREFGDDAHA